MLSTKDNGREADGDAWLDVTAPGTGRRSAIIVGAGVVGMASAYALARRGVAVTVVERRAAAGCEASFANGAQLSYAYTDALASPALMRHLPAVLLGLDPAIRLRPALDPDHLAWLLRFVRNATPRRFMANTLGGLELGLESQRAMHALLQRHRLDFGHNTTGKLHVHANDKSLAAAAAMVMAKRAHGAEQQVLSAADAIALEPTLADHARFAGAVFTPGDEVGDPQRFCTAMTALLQRDYGVTFRFCTTVATIDEACGQACVETTSGERLTADDLVICAAIGTGPLAARFGLGSLLMPIKGYSFTAPAGAAGLRVSVTDVARKIVFCPLAGKIRVAGLAEIGARSTTVDPAALERLRSGARASLPNAANYEQIGPGWAGIRPMMASSFPRIGRVSPRIAVNIGHGMLGWTYSMGSAERLARVVLENVE